MKKVYTVEVDNYRTLWSLNGNVHREDGPAVEWKTTGSNDYYLDNKLYTKAEHAIELARRNSHDGKKIIIEGKKYSLTLCD